VHALDVDRAGRGVLEGPCRLVREQVERADRVEPPPAAERELVDEVLDDAKRKGMSAFQPTALTLSRGDLWADRRSFAEAVLDTGRPIHRLGQRFAAVAVEEADAVLGLGRPVTWADVHEAFQRLTRRVVIGADAADDTAHYPGLLVNVAVGYGGRREIADAVRSLLQEQATKGTTIEELAEALDVEHIAEHLYTAGQPDPDLVIRTSGEQRLGGFLLWQSAHSEFYFCDAYWPDFRRVDFLRALRSYSARKRRFGS